MKRLPHVLFVSYGAGHIQALLPVALALQHTDIARVSVLGLTTAAAAVKPTGLRLLGFKDFVTPSDVQALAWGAALAAELPAIKGVEPAESVAYLGLSYAELCALHGLDHARALYQRHGRQAFLPVETLERILVREKPDLVVISNAPRAERAAGIAAGQLGIPALCLNTLFALDEIEWLRDAAFCDRICVLNPGVKSHFVQAGRPAEQVIVSGNPAFDDLLDPNSLRAGAVLRSELGPVGHIVLWASQPEPASHPTVPGKLGDPLFPGRIRRVLEAWAEGPGRRLLVRPHPSEPPPTLTAAHTVLCPASQALAPVLHAVDAVVTMTSTVGVEANMAGRPVIQVLGSLFDHSSPFVQMGIARSATLDNLATILDETLENRVQHEPAGPRTRATQNVVAAISDLLP